MIRRLKTILVTVLPAISLGTADLASTAFGAPLGTSFTYQGKLEQNGTPVSATADFRFRIFNALSGGAQVGSTQTANNVTVAGGLFAALIDFGAAPFNGDALWLEIDVRSPGGSGTFVTLTPRQPLTAAPYALKVPGVDGHSLNASDGNPNDALFVNGVGNVGVGTTTPNKRLTVDGDMEIGTHSGDYHHLRIGGGNSDGFIYGSFPALGDGIHLGYNFYYDGGGGVHVIHPGGATSRVSAGYGYVTLATGGVAQSPVDRLVVTPGGNVGIGTSLPAERLEVRGDIKLGGLGELYTTSGEENLRIVRGTVGAAGNVLEGAGFTASRDSQGDYFIFLNTLIFAGAPSVIATADDETMSSAARIATVYVTSSNAFRVRVRNLSGNVEDQKFHFWAIGRR